MSLENKLIIVVQTADNKFCNIAFAGDFSSGSF